MRVETRLTGDTLVARIEGELDLLVTDEFREQVDRLLWETGSRKLLLDLASVSFLDSTGIGAILGRYRKLKEKGGAMAILRPQVQVHHVLEISGVVRVVEVFSEESAALKTLREGGKLS